MRKRDLTDSWALKIASLKVQGVPIRSPSEGRSHVRILEAKSKEEGVRPLHGQVYPLVAEFKKGVGSSNGGKRRWKQENKRREVRRK